MKIDELRKIRRIRQAQRRARRRRPKGSSDWLYLFLCVLILSEIERKL